MARLDHHLDRLLRGAAQAPSAELPGEEIPFGFDTRIVALWRSLRPNESRDVSRFLRRVTLLAAVVALVTGAFTYRQLDEDNNDDDAGQALTNDYAIADSAIQTEFSP